MEEFSEESRAADGCHELLQLVEIVLSRHLIGGISDNRAGTMMCLFFSYLFLHNSMCSIAANEKSKGCGMISEDGKLWPHAC